MLLAIDPGHEQSAYVVFDEERGIPTSWELLNNWNLLHRLDGLDCDRIAIEKITSFGMAVGQEIFETCVWTGRFMERWRLADDSEALRVSRMDVKHFLCHTARAKDANIRQALVDSYGGKDRAIGRKATPGPLYGLTGHCWAALAVAVTAIDVMQRPEQLSLSA